MRFADRIAFVTGGGGGLGRAIAAGLRAEGARVWLADRCLAGFAPPDGGGFGSVPLDVADFRGVRDAVARVQEAAGGIDLLVNCAGIARQAPFLELTAESWDEHIAVLLSGTFYTCRSVAPGMVARGWGRIVNVASIGGLAGPVDAVHYGAAKAGVIGMTRAIATELAETGVTCNAVAPGPVMTGLLRSAWSPEGLAARHEQVPARRLGTPEDIAAACLFLLSPDAGYVTGTTLPVDGGSTAAGAYAVELSRRRAAAAQAAPRPGPAA